MTNQSDDVNSSKLNAPLTNIKPVKINPSDRVTPAIFTISKNNVPVTIIHSALTDPPTTNSMTKPVLEPRTDDVTVLVNKNNNNEDDRKDGRKNGGTNETKERTYGEWESVSDGDIKPPSSSTGM